ncbi:MAG TPA: CapA family protein [Candidatus Limnocylindrales bacterium]|nr:CapA family protein [Candidatus Limnocylindrales bacterium]
MHPRSPRSRPVRAGLALLAATVLLAACSDNHPSTPPSGGPGVTLAPGATPTAPLGTDTPSSTPGTIPAEFPLAVVTGLENNKTVITMDELSTLTEKGELLYPCGIVGVEMPNPSMQCVPGDQIAATVQAKPTTIALLPVGLVEPATKVLAFKGDGPFGLFGPDLFGGPDQRALQYPLHGSLTGTATVDPAWVSPVDSGQIWTLNETGSLCADRGGAKQAVTLKKGWDWVFNGGTAKYTGKPIPNPNPPPGIDRHPIVRPVETGNDGATSKLIASSDVTLGNLKCPVLPTKDWHPANQQAGLSVPEDVLDRWESFLGIDAVYLPADHQSDRGVRGIKSTLDLLEKHGFPGTGLGMNLDQALEPAYLDVAGLKVAFVSWDNVPGPTHAAANTPGVAWMTKSNINAAVQRARDGGADLIVCNPQWWAGSEYREQLFPNQQKALGWMDAAGCDQVLGGGLHVSGAVYLRKIGAGALSVVDAGPGNFQYGQDFWQNTQEGVVVQLVFRGSNLVNVRLYPYVMILAARAALLDPEADGHYVLDRIWSYSELDYRN